LVPVRYGGYGLAYRRPRSQRVDQVVYAARQALGGHSACERTKNPEQ